MIIIDNKKMNAARLDRIFRKPNLDTNYLLFSPEEPNGFVELITPSSLAISLEYSYNGDDWSNWEKTTSGGNYYFKQILLEDTYDYVAIRATATNESFNGAHFNFGNTTIKSFGSLMSLLNKYASGTTINANYAFYGLFSGCTTLISAPELPATALSRYCYCSMFDGCSSMKNAPELPATTLDAYCYAAMFYGCTSLISAPKLPATTLNDYCYYQMFYGCTSLMSTPKLPATTLENSCYYQMFYNCTSLTTGVDLRNVTNIGTLSCVSMYDNCTNLNIAYAPRVSSWTTECFDNWLNNVASSGTMYKTATLSMPQGPNGVPNGWFLNAYDGCLYFEAQQTGSTIGIEHYGTNSGQTKPVIYFSTDNCQTWAQWDSTTITLQNVGDRVYMYGANPNGVSRGQSNYSTFIMSGLIAAGGDCNTLINVDGGAETTLSNSCYRNLFRNCTSLIHAPELPSTTLRPYCYASMFNGCINLTVAPELPATTLESYCYFFMFKDCTSLTKAPELPATTLAIYCYYEMFNGCTGLTKAPELPATTLASDCYCYMFVHCTNLTKASELPATTLDIRCYYGMFFGCTSLTSGPEILPAAELTASCYYRMFADCTSLTKAPELPAQTLVSSCYKEMFLHCSNLNYIKVGTTTWSSGQASNWVSGVGSGGTFSKPASTTIPYDNSGIPNNWYVQNY